MWEGKGDAVAAGGKELISASIFLAIHQRTSEWDHGERKIIIIITEGITQLSPYITGLIMGAERRTRRAKCKTPTCAAAAGVNNRESIFGLLDTEFIFTARQIWQRIRARSKLNYGIRLN